MALEIIQSPNTLSYTRNPINIVVALEADPEFEDVYALCFIYSSISNKITTLFARPDKNYYANFDISAILDAITSFSTPQIDNLHVREPDFAQPYWCEILQYSNNKIVNGVNIGNVYDTITLFAIKGGLSQEKIELDIFSLISTNKMFLTWLTEAKVIPTQRYYLYYLHLEDEETAAAKAKIYYDDGTTENTTLYNFNGVTKYCLLKIEAGFIVQGLENLNPAKTALYYEVWVESISGAILRAGKFKFTLSTAYVPFPITITNANSLGGFDFISMKGNITTNSIPKSTEISHITDNESYISSSNHTIQRQRKAATGHISKERLLALTDIFLSNERYEIIGDKELIKINASNKSKLEFNETDNLFGMILEYSRASINKNYTPDVTD